MAALVVLAGCQTTAWVRVAVQPDGSGSVVVDVYLDAEAAAQVGDLSAIVAVGDLEKAGWTVAGPAPPHAVQQASGSEPTGGPGDMPEGTVQIRLEHPFSDIDEANQVLANLGGPFRDVELTRHSSLYKTELGFTGTVDLRGGLDVFGDADLTRALGGTLADKVAAADGTPPSGDDLQVGLQLVPSKDLDWSGQTGNDSMGNQTVGASASLGAGPETIDVQASKTRWGAVIGTVAVVGLALVGLVVFGFSYRRRANRAQSGLFDTGGPGRSR